MKRNSPKFAKSVLLFLMVIGLTASGFAQWHSSLETCSQDCTNGSCVQYYFDVDGDNTGVDDPGTNKWHCSEEPAPSPELYSTQSGDLWPFDDSKAFEVDLVGGCTFFEACNYSSQASANDGSCVFPKSCQTCSLNPDNSKIVDGSGVVLVSDYPAQLHPCGCELVVDPNTGVESVVNLFRDAVGNCLQQSHSLFCSEDADGDGICDQSSDGSISDPCVGSATQKLDDCGNCSEPGSGTYFFLDTDNDGSIDALNETTPCNPGDDNCLDANGKCNCEGLELNNCYTCGVDDILSGYDCDGEFICVDENPQNGICDVDEQFGCLDATACNYDASAVNDDGSCLEEDVCGICGGDGIPAGACEDPSPENCFFYPTEYYDCDGSPINDVNVNGTADELDIHGCADTDACNYNADVSFDDGSCLSNDALEQCGGTCLEDLDGDGICDDNGQDPCVGVFDECGVCNGTGIPADACDCDGNQEDAVFECGGNCIEDVDGDLICDLDADGNVLDTFICSEVVDAAGVCGGSCTLDSDEDGICDDIDNCVGQIDVCGVCNGTGIPAGYCDCDGNQLDNLGQCGGACQEDADGDGICDDNGNDSCVGNLDECGVCNGTGIPADACDCNGNVEDALFECGGNCLEDSDGDGICDLDSDGNALDTCVGQEDACGVCNGDGPLSCGCEPIQNGECDCNGNREDECGVCGGAGPAFGKNCDGTCIADADNDGICDAEDPIIMERVYYSQELASGNNIMVQPPIDTKDAYEQLVGFHDKMSVNLNEGSPTGTSNHLTVQESIVSNGSLVVKGETTLESDVVVNGFVNVDYNANIGGDVTVEGVQFSNGGIQTASIQNSGDMSVGGLLQVDMNMTVESASELAQTGVSGDFFVHNGLNASNEIEEGITDVTFSIVSSTGNIRAAGDLDADADISIAGKATLNGLNADDRSEFQNLTMDGSLDLNSSADFEQNLRINGDKFTVDHLGTTRIAGDLDVGANMNIAGLAHIQGDLTVEGTFFANGGVLTTSVKMKGDLDVGQDTNFGKDFQVNGTTAAESHLNAASNFSVYNGVGSTSEKFNISNATENIETSGSFSGVNLNSRANANFEASLTGTTNLTVEGNTTAGNLTVGGSAQLLGGAEVDINGTGQAQSLSLDGDLTTSGLATLGSLNNSETLTVGGGGGVTLGGLDLTGTTTGPTDEIASFTNKAASGHGIKVKLGVANPGKDHDYVAFQNSAGIELGRIRGEKVSELNHNAFYALDKDDMNLTVQLAGTEKTLADIALGASIANTTVAAAEVVAAAVSFTGCVGFGFCATMPIGSFIAAAVVNAVSAGVGLADAIFQNNQAAANEQQAISLRNEFNNAVENGDRVPVGSEKIGVTYESGAADYAEWMPKKNPSQNLRSGQIVGVHKGQISLNTNKADHLFVISTQPIVLGNAPARNFEGYEKCAFLGQVPTNIQGPVRAGDYILASGFRDGFGVAKSSTDLKASDMKSVVGVAWENGLLPGVNRVNVAVGLNDAIHIVAANLESRLSAVEKEADALENLIFSQMKGEALSLYRAQEAGLAPRLILPDHLVQETTDLSNPDVWSVPNSSDYVVHEITPELMEYAWPIALQNAKSLGINTKQSPTWTRLKKDDAYRAEFLEEMRQSINDYNKDAIDQIDKLAEMEVFSVTTGTNFIYSNNKDSRQTKESSKKHKRK